MSLELFRWVLAGVFVLEIIGSFFLPNGAGSLGVSSEWANEGYRFAAGSSVWALSVAAVNVILYLALMKMTVAASAGLAMTGLFKRWLAFWIDFVWVMASVAPLAGLLAVLLEAKHTNHFVWAFERTTRSGTDIPIAIVAGLINVAALVFYFALPVMWGRPSPGACLLGYQVLPNEPGAVTLGKAVQRELYGFVAVCGAPLAPFVSGGRLVNSWLDEKFGVRAVTLK